VPLPDEEVIEIVDSDEEPVVIDIDQDDLEPM
jgi:hypothetical protein